MELKEIFRRNSLPHKTPDMYTKMCHGCNANKNKLNLLDSFEEM